MGIEMQGSNARQGAGLSAVATCAVWAAWVAFALGAPAVQAQSDMDALVKAAKAEGDVTFYSADIDNKNKNVADGFLAKYGIKAQYIRLGNAPMLQRYGAEVEAGNAGADLIIMGGSTTAFSTEAVKKGWIEPVQQAGLPTVRGGEYQARFMRGAAAVLGMNVWVIGYNTDKISAANAPKDWQDLVDPKFRGQILAIDPHTSDAYFDIYSMLLDKFGEGYFNRLRAQNPRYFTLSEPAVQGLGAGEGQIMLPTVPAQVLNIKSKGAPIAYVTPENTTGVELQLMLTSRAKSKRPNAGRLLANFMLSAEGNKLFNGVPGAVGLYDTAALPKQYEAPKPPDQARKLQIYKLMGIAP